MTTQDIGPRLVERPSSLVLAEVDITDDYGVEVRQLRKRVSYSADEARALAHSILKSARDADAAFREDRLAAASTPLQPLRFDLAPMCRDCSEGKHGACIGSTFVETAADVAPDEVECGCSKAGHTDPSDRPWLHARPDEVWVLHWYTEVDGDHPGERAVKLTNGFFDLLDGDGYVSPKDVLNARHEAVAS